MSNNIGSVNLMKNYINDCKRKKVIINLPSVNYSRDDFVVYNNEIYYSLLGVAQLGALTLNNFLAEREIKTDLISLIRSLFQELKKY